MKISTVTRRAVAGIAAVGALTCLAACEAAIPGSAEPGPGASPTASAPGAIESSPASAAPRTSDRICNVTVGPNRISVSGGGRVRTTNGRTEFACGNGPALTIVRIDEAGVAFQLNGAEVSVAPGQAAPVGPYQVTVTSVDRGTAVLEVAPPG